MDLTEKSSAIDKTVNLRVVEPHKYNLTFRSLETPIATKLKTLQNFEGLVKFKPQQKEFVAKL